MRSNPKQSMQIARPADWMPCYSATAEVHRPSPTSSPDDQAFI